MSVRTLDSLTRLGRRWLSSRFCGFCEASCLGRDCGALSGKYALPIIEGVRDEEEVIDLGPPCNMDARRAKWLTSYKPRGAA